MDEKQYAALLVFELMNLGYVAKKESNPNMVFLKKDFKNSSIYIEVSLGLVTLSAYGPVNLIFREGTNEFNEVNIAKTILRVHSRLKK